MAFLCPVRMRRDKKKATNANIERDLPLPVGGLGLNHGMGRITGSSSIETLVRVGIEKEHGLSPDSKMVVLHDFTPCVDDELEVKRGQAVNILYRENDWVYVIGQDSRQEGFIPFSYCAPFNTQLAEMAVKKKQPREQQSVIAEQNETIPLLEAEVKIDDDLQKLSNSTNSLKPAPSELPLIIEPECTPFIKKPSGRFIVLYTFIARDENDLSVERGEFVTVLNREDPDWFWIIRNDGEEGFVPASFIYPAETVLQTQQKILNAAQKVQEPINNVGNILPAVSNGTLNKIANLNASDLTNATATLKSLNLNQSNHMERSSLQQYSQSQQQQTQTHPQPQSQAQVQPQPQPQQQPPQQQPQQQQPPQKQPQPQPQNLPPPTQEVGLATEDLRYHGTELVMLYDYKAQAPDDLSVRRGDWIYADLNNQTVDGWLWAYAPKTRKYGFIPKAYARPPAMTSL